MKLTRAQARVGPGVDTPLPESLVFSFAKIFSLLFVAVKDQSLLTF